MRAKVHCRKDSTGRELKVVAVCDKELLGKVFGEGGCVLDLKSYASFYDGAGVTEDKAVELIRNAENLNLVGKKAVAAAGKAIEIDAKSVRKIAGVPHLQVYSV